jgi:hypothetical protein
MVDHKKEYTPSGPTFNTPSLGAVTNAKNENN